MKNNQVRIKLIHIKRENNNNINMGHSLISELIAIELELKECYKEVYKIREKSVSKS